MTRFTRFTFALQWTAWLGLAMWAWTSTAQVNETPDQRDARLQWWREARFGMFVHWGPVSLKGTEIGWSRGDQVPADVYDTLYKEWNPTKFDARAWVKLARDTGVKYLVLTSKHHDGFCLWDSQFTDYDIMSTPFHRDVVRELADACRKGGIRFCTYHSICDWHHPDYPLGSPGGRSPKANADMDRYNQYLKDQLGELLTRYGPLGVMWFDGEWEKPWTQERGMDLYQYVRSIQPEIIVNNRVSPGRQDMEGATKAGAFGGDYDTPEQRVGKFQNTRPWESCITICQQWAWKPDDAMKPLQECVRTLVTCAGGDGNLLLNVGPMPSGEIEPRQAERLREMGAWLKKNGKSIYATRGGPYKPAAWGAATYRDKTIWLHVFDWKGEALRLPPLGATIKSASNVTGGSVKVTQNDSGILVEVPARDRQAIDTIIALKIDRVASDIQPIDVP